MILMVEDARKSTRTHLLAASREVHESTGKLIGHALYGVGRHRWLRRRPDEPGSTPSAPGQGEWLHPDELDGHELPVWPPAKKVTMTADPS
jgi:hypothetical protein